jgi:hypothetical protein
MVLKRGIDNMAVKKDNQSKLEKIANLAAEQAVKKYHDQEKEKKKDYRFRNTRLLLKNYNLFRDHLKNAKSNIKEVNDVIDIKSYDEDELYINSIRKSKLKTLIILSHIEVALEQLKWNMEEKNQLEKYQVIEDIYINQNTYEEIAEKLNCNSMTVRRWEKEATNELSILLFGIDGMKLDK